MGCASLQMKQLGESKSGLAPALPRLVKLQHYLSKALIRFKVLMRGNNVPKIKNTIHTRPHPAIS